MGHGLGPGFATVATRRSVILSAEGLELVLTLRRRRLFGRGFPRQKRAAHDPGRGLEQIPPSYLAIAFKHCRILLSDCWVSGNRVR